MKKSNALCILFCLLAITSCTKSGSPVELTQVEKYVKGDGAFVLNEGNYMKGNGSLSFYSYGESQLYNDIFYLANNRILGDVPYSMQISGEKGYLIVNNSGNIEVININTVKVISTISGLVSPRNMLIINDTKAYVSSLYSNYLKIINLQNNTISDSINLRRTSEAMVISGGKAFVSSWASGKEIMVINTATDKVIDSISVAPEPESMVLDKNNKLWILCSGGYTGQTLAELVVVNPTTDAIEKRLVFASKSSYPTGLKINSTKDSLYYVDNGIWKMSIQSTSLPVLPFTTAGNRSIYKIGVDPRNQRVFFTNAMDYQRNGYVIQLNSGGHLVDSCRSDIIPGTICFK